MLSKRRLSTSAFFLAFVLHTTYQISRGFFNGAFTIRPVFGETFFLPWCIALLSLIIILYSRKEKAGSSIVFLVFSLCLIALMLPKGVSPPVIKSKTIFADLFFLFEVLAHASFGIGAWLALLFILGKASQKDRLFSNFVVWGFAFFTVAQVVGAVWAYLGWSTPFLWGDRHLKSVSTWIYYACFLHLSLFKEWNLKKRAYFALTGFIFILAGLFAYSFQSIFG
ncbi:MAG: cytochrome c biogenesis protein CcsA [Thermodesulfobacteriota bacterium]|nr:cytochrome c biogenesis protein CcsA [Thermodesulfobacteriota bacterium]